MIFKVCLEVIMCKEETQKTINKKKSGNYGCLPEDGVASASKTNA
jgi:hypothetical protein